MQQWGTHLFCFTSQAKSPLAWKAVFGFGGQLLWLFYDLYKLHFPTLHYSNWLLHIFLATLMEFIAVAAKCLNIRFLSVRSLREYPAQCALPILPSLQGWLAPRHSHSAAGFWICSLVGKKKQIIGRVKQTQWSLCNVPFLIVFLDHGVLSTQK